MTDSPAFEVAGYRLDEALAYDPASHLWVDTRGGDRWRVGLDPLGAETSGDIVAVSFEPAGRAVARGEAFGNLEAAKFVGPLESPVAGTLLRHNDEVLARPSLINDDPLSHWLVELEAPPGAELPPALLRGRQQVAEWFATEVERVRSEGLVAE